MEIQDLLRKGCLLAVRVGTGCVANVVESTKMSGNPILGLPLTQHIVPDTQTMPDTVKAHKIPAQTQRQIICNWRESML